MAVERSGVVYNLAPRERIYVELDLLYLKALIEECADPIAVLQRSGLPGECDSEFEARNALLRQLAKPSTYNVAEHGSQIAALKALGVDLPGDDHVMVGIFKQSGSSSKSFS